MPERRFFTPDGEPPNGGIPPETSFVFVRPRHGPPPPLASDSASASPPVLPPPPPYPVSRAAVAAPPSPPLPPMYQPAPAPPQAIHHHYHHVLSLVPSTPLAQPPAVPAAAAITPVAPPPATTTTTPTRPPSPPGTRLNGHPITFPATLDFGYIFPANHITVHFLYDGTQPWLFPSPSSPSSPSVSTHHPHPHPHPQSQSLRRPCIHFSKFVVPTCMTVREFILQLGAPSGARGEEERGREGDEEGKRNGVTECVDLGNGAWGMGRTFRVGGEESRGRIEDVGFLRSGDGVVWLAVWTLP